MKTVQIRADTKSVFAVVSPALGSDPPPGVEYIHVEDGWEPTEFPCHYNPATKTFEKDTP